MERERKSVCVCVCVCSPEKSKRINSLTFKMNECEAHGLNALLNCKRKTNFNLTNLIKATFYIQLPLPIQILIKISSVVLQHCKLELEGTSKLKKISMNVG